MKISFGVDLGFASDYFKGYGTILRCLVCAFAQSVLPLTSWGNFHYTQVETPATKTFPSFDILHYRVRWPVGKIRTLSSSWKNVTSLLHHNSNEDKDGFCGICIRSKLLGTKQEPKSLVNH